VKQSFETRITTLDLHGRPVVVLEKENLINQYNRALFQVSYTYNTTSIYRKPLSIAGALFVTFVALMFLSRFSLTILPVRLLFYQHVFSLTKVSFSRRNRNNVCC